MKWTTAFACVALVLTACGSGESLPPDDARDPVESSPATDPDPTERAPEVRTPSSSNDLSAAVDAAVADLIGRLGMGDNDIRVSSAETVTWSDGALGCPEPGTVYTQALVEDGYRIVLIANGEEYPYHGAGEREPFYCATPQEPYREGGRS